MVTLYVRGLSHPLIYEKYVLALHTIGQKCEDAHFINKWASDKVC